MPSLNNQSRTLEPQQTARRDPRRDARQFAVCLIPAMSTRPRLSQDMYHSHLQVWRFTKNSYLQHNTICGRHRDRHPPRRPTKQCISKQKHLPSLYLFKHWQPNPSMRTQDSGNQCNKLSFQPRFRPSLRSRMMLGIHPNGK